ncbi:hypothetical protein L9F63_015638 [Diploptera punctata]|uniref:WASH complex subunit 3 n=1 Tax=Diploptera punctata TaxID=6984 RepID=A0AAD8EJX5_DIPPU|nr:hypothetical protein L9F63_015638 [Diploptera punctata]
MDVDGLPIIGPGLDYSQVGAIHQKRTLAFINHFICNTVSFLNKFSCSCELRLEKFEMRLQKLEASLSILEAKLSSLSGLENAVVDPQVSDKVEEMEEVDKNSDSVTEINDKSCPEANEMQEESEVEKPTLAQDPQYAKFFKMVHFGVPVQAVQLKMQQEGLDPSVLE